MKQGAARGCNRADRLERLDGADLVIGCRDRYQPGFIRDERLQNAKVHLSRAEERSLDNFELRFEAASGRDHRSVFAGGDDDPPAANSQKMRDKANDREIVRFGGPRCENQFAGSNPEELSDLAARCFHGAERGVGRGRMNIYVMVAPRLHQDLRHFGVKRRVGMMIQIDERFGQEAILCLFVKAARLA